MLWFNLQNLNSVFAINIEDKDKKRSGTFIYSAITGLRVQEKQNTDLLYRQVSKGKSLKFNLDNTTFYEQGDYDRWSLDSKNVIILRDFKRVLYETTNGIFTQRNILQGDIVVKTSGMNFVLQQAFSVAFAMILDHVHRVLVEEFEYKYEPLTFICTVPESAQLDQSIFTRNALVNGLVMLK